MRSLTNTWFDNAMQGAAGRWIRTEALPSLPTVVRDELTLSVPENYWREPWPDNLVVAKQADIIFDNYSNLSELLHRELMAIPGVGEAWTEDLKNVISQGILLGITPGELILGDAQRLQSMCRSEVANLTGVKPVSKQALRNVREWWSDNS